MGYVADNHYKAGSWNAICDVCGFKFKSFDLKKRWDGLMVCKADFEHDHPQKFLRVREDNSSVPWVRSEPTDTFIPVCTMATRSAIPGTGQPGCLIPSETNVMSF